MSNDDAKFLLHAYRPDGRDAQDPQFAEALDQAKNDPALGEWFRKQRAFDSIITGKMQAVPVPPTLKRDILAGRATLRPGGRWTRRSTVTALAACFVVCLGVVATLLTLAGRQEFARYRADMVGEVNALEAGLETLDYTSSNWVELQDWLANDGAQEDVQLPASLMKAGSGVGCRLVNWEDESVVLICFRLGSTGPVAHLFVIDQGRLKEEPVPGKVQSASLDGMNTRAWTDRGKTFLVVSRAPMETLSRLL